MKEEEERQQSWHHDNAGGLNARGDHMGTEKLAADLTRCRDKQNFKEFKKMPPKAIIDFTPGCPILPVAALQSSIPHMKTSLMIAARAGAHHHWMPPEACGACFCGPADARCRGSPPGRRATEPDNVAPGAGSEAPETKELPGS